MTEVTVLLTNGQVLRGELIIERLARLDVRVNGDKHVVPHSAIIYYRTWEKE